MTAHQVRRIVRAQIAEAFGEFRRIGWPQRAAFELAFLHVMGTLPTPGFRWETAAYDVPTWGGLPT